MKFIRGNRDFLHGRAVIFMDLKESGDFEGERSGLPLLAVFCAASELDLLELIVRVMHLPREHSRLVSRFYKRYFQEIEKIKRSFPERISKIIEEVIEEEQEEVSEPVLDSFREMFRRSREKPGEDGEAQEAREYVPETGVRLPEPEFYSTMIPLPGQFFITAWAQNSGEEGLDFDIIDLERKEGIEVAHLVLDAHSRLYVADYMNQKEKQIDLPRHAEYVSPFKNYKQISKEEFKRHLTELSSELMFLSETGRETERVFADLKKLTSGSFLMREVVSMYNISTTEDPNKIKLMELYFRKIFSLIDENYLLTRKIDEEIKQYSV